MRRVCACRGDAARGALPVAPRGRRHQDRRRALARQRRRPDGGLGRARAAALARSSVVRPPDAEGRGAHGAGRLSQSRAEQGRLGLGQHWRATRRLGVLRGRCGRPGDIRLTRSIRRWSPKAIMPLFQRCCGRWPSGSRKISDPLVKASARPGMSSADVVWRRPERTAAPAPSIPPKCSRLQAPVSLR